MYSKLSDHDFQKGIFKSKFSQIVSPLPKNLDWQHARGPEYIWIGLVLKGGCRTEKLEKLMAFFNELSKNIDLKERLPLPTISHLLDLKKSEKKLFFEILEKYFDLSIFSPLALVLPDNEESILKKIYSCNREFEERSDSLKSVLKEVSDQHSSLSADIRYLITYYSMLKGNLRFLSHQKALIERLKEYPYLDENSVEISMIRSQISALEMTLSTAFEEIDFPYSRLFWDSIGRLTDCEVYYMEISQNTSYDLNEIRQEVYKVLKYYTALLQNVEPFNEKLFVLTSILTYSYKRLIELIDHNLGTTISGRSIVRSCIENYVMSKYLIENEQVKENIWREFQYYGLGNYKLISERYLESQPDFANAHINFHYLNLLVSEFQNKEFTDMDTRYFGNENIRKKFQQVGEDDLYKYQYDYDSQFEHGLWGAIRESSVLKCISPGHQYHGVPDIDNIQSLQDVSFDVGMILEKHLSVIKKEFPIVSE